MPTDPTDPFDPFEALRRPVVPLAPDPAFAARLQAQVREALGRSLASARPERTSTMSTTDTDLRAGTFTFTPDAPAAAVIPYLSVTGAAAAIDFYVEAFGAIELMRYVGDDGRVGHAELTIGGARFNLADEYPELAFRSPTALGGTPVGLMLDVVDVDYTYDRAIDLGATGPRPPEDQSHGHRTATVVDPFGHRWMLSQPIESLTPAQLDQREPEWTVTGRRPVELGYLTMHVGDLDRAAAFFGALFDWDLHESGEGRHIANTRFPMGMTGGAEPPTGGDAPLTVYFRVDDIDPYAAKVEELGGRVLSRAVHPSGGNAECVDDQGFRFDLFQPAPGY